MVLVCLTTGWLQPLSVMEGRGSGGTHCYLLERLLPGVCADVVVQRGGAGKRPAAVAALERPVAGVCDHVVTELRGLGEGLGTVAALVRSVETRTHTCTCTHTHVHTHTQRVEGVRGL